MAQYVYTMRRVSKTVPPKRTILKNISLNFFPGAKIGVLGLNGSGKSSLLKIMAGADDNHEGEVVRMPGIRVGYLEQEPVLSKNKTVRESVEEALGETAAAKKRLEEVYAAYSEPDADFDKLAEEQAKLEAMLNTGGADELEIAADALRLPPWEQKVDVLSGGEKRRVALCRLLLSKPDLLLLDEPTNHLDAESVEWLERFLAEFPGTVVAITHDRYFLDNVAKWILELDRGKGIPWEGNYSSWLDQKKNRLAQEEKTESARQRALQRELEWVRMAPRARQAKSKSRIQKYEELAEQDTGEKVLQQEITIPPPPRLGNDVVIAKGLKKAYGDKVLFDDLTFSLPRGGIVGVIGPNGAGKTTTFKLITGQEKPDAGTLRLGETVQVGYVDQSRELNANKSVFDEITGGLDELEMGKKKIASRAYVSWFNFKGAQQQRKVGTLSGGERNRVHLAKLLQRGSNLLLLDEPTNDLDVDTLRALEEALLNYAGCAVVISHDRWFLDRVATHMLAFEGDSRVVWFEGNYQDYEADRKRRLGAEADTPHRIKYRKLTR
jgi:energy-dependent translational throttle protein EttA